MWPCFRRVFWFNSNAKPRSFDGPQAPIGRLDAHISDNYRTKPYHCYPNLKRSDYNERSGKIGNPFLYFYLFLIVLTPIFQFVGGLLFFRRRFVFGGIFFLLSLIPWITRISGLIWGDWTPLWRFHAC